MMDFYSRIKFVHVIREDEINKLILLLKKPASTIAGFLIPVTYIDR
jgi:hypothetical protein